MRRLLPLVFAGAALATTQQLAMREIASALFGEEIVVLLVTVTLFAAISVGYAVSPLLERPRVRSAFFVAGCLVHLALPALPRYGFALVASRPIAPLAFATALAAVLLAPLATLLPRTVDSFDDRVRGMRLSYAAEVVGFLLGLGLAQACFGRPIAIYLAVHWLLLNEYLAIVPAKLTHPARTLIIGNGTLSLVAPLVPLTNELVTVEIDPVVVEAGVRFFSPNAARSHPRWTRIEADGKAFLARTTETFDLVIVDVPSPLSFQEAFLHTREFYALLASRLSPQGVAAVQLSGRRLHGADRSPSRITAALVTALPDTVVVESKIATRAFAYASKHLPFTADDVRAVAPPSEARLVVHDPAAVRERIRGVAPLDLDSLDLVLRRGLERLVHRREEAR